MDKGQVFWRFYDDNTQRNEVFVKVVVPEWLSGMTRNHVGFARAGSNPADHDFFVLLVFCDRPHHLAYDMGRY
jgi:hypothetical protein